MKAVGTTRIALDLAGRLGIDVPVTREMAAVLFEGKDAMTAMRDLMTRDLKAEDGSGDEGSKG